MKIQFIGTGTMGSTTKNNTSVLIDDVLFDCGMGTIKQFERLGNRVNDLNYVVITHYHADHFFDIPNFIIGKKIRNELDKKISIIGPTGIRQKTYDLMIFSFGDLGSLEEYANIEFIELEPNQTINLNDIELTAIELKHGNTNPNYGYLVKKQNKIVSYTGDTTICDAFYEMCEKSDYLITDTCMPKESNHAHIGLNDLLEVANRYKNCKFYSVHRGDYDIPKTDNIMFPADGEIVNIEK